eukprot:3162736-Amphidinium_carterae.1
MKITRLHFCGSVSYLCGPWLRKDNVHVPFPIVTEAEALLLEGTIPASASRLTMADTTISLGHGLRGLVPSTSGTVRLLSLWENVLQGQLHPHSPSYAVYLKRPRC